MIYIRRIFCTSISIVAILFGTLLLNSAIVTGSSDCDSCKLPCENGDCIDAALWCDSTEDCSDGSDEKYCKRITLFDKDPNRCPSMYFRCRDGPCIPLVGRCDGISNCYDSSDEQNCENYHTTTEAAVISTTIEPKGFNEIRFFNSLNSSQYSDQMKQFLGFHPSNLSKQRILARNWLLSQRRDDYGWVDESPRAITALYLSDERPLVTRTESDMLMVKQLEIQFFLELMRNGIKSMKLADLALYVNALLVSCKDPKNFYGENLIRALRDGVDAAEKVDEVVNPFIYLTLCISNATTFDDINKLQDIFLNKNEGIGMIDIQSLALLATACIFRKTNYLNESKFDMLKMEFLRNVKLHGFPGNVHEAALLFQALQEMKVTIEGLIDFILKWQQADGSFGDILSAYLVLPTLFGKNMLHMTDHCGQRNTSDLTPIEVLINAKSKKMLVQYSLNYGFPPEIKHTLQMHVAEGTNFLDIMRLAQEINPKYRFKLNENREVPVVYSIGEMPNDAEKGMYWALYKTSRKNNETTNENHWMPFIGDVKQLIIADGDKMLFWYRPL